MVRLFRAPRLSEKSDIRLLDPLQERAQKESGVLFKKIPRDFSLSAYALVSSLEEADFAVIPQSIRAVDAETESYLDALCVELRRTGKKAIAFVTGDYANRVHISREELIVFKSFEYRKNRRENEAVFAPFVEDLGEEMGVSIRRKSDRPTVSFCGYAGFRSRKAELKYLAQNAWYDLVGKPEYKRGIYFRKKGMEHLARDARIATRFIVRNFFSGNLTTAAASPQTLRSEFVESIVGSDFVLCPKGDGNYSSRFYETLSLGRIPILIDTDMVLPFETQIDFSRIMVRVPNADLGRIGEYVMRFYEGLSEAEFESRQKEARRIFREYLRYDAYFSRALALLKDGGIAALA